jgi:dihydroxy-acid dehydratase
MFDKHQRNIPRVLGPLPSGKRSASLFWRAGGVPAVMEEIKIHLHLDALTATGKTLGDNLEDLKKCGFYEPRGSSPSAPGLEKTSVVLGYETPSQEKGSVAFLKGNLAPQGAIAPISAIFPKTFTGRAAPFDSVEDLCRAAMDGRIKPGDVIVIKNSGLRGAGMPSATAWVAAISAELFGNVALVTDGRLPEMEIGAAAGHVTPDAAGGGPLGLVEENDLICLDIPKRKLNLSGIGLRPASKSQIAKELERRRKEAPSKKPAVSGASKTPSQPAQLKGGFLE